jgi:D-hydroxyproline dehydrogenase subunit alpha
MSDSPFEFEVVVVGAGPAGLAAACAAAEDGRRTAVLDDSPWLGGQIWRGEQRRHSNPQAGKWLARFSQCGATLLDQTTAIACPRPGVVLAEHPAGPREIRWQRLIVATGARELFLPFPGWTLPGVLGPGGLQALVKNGWPIDGQRVVVAGSGPLLLAVADGIKKFGAKVVSIAEQAPFARIRNFGLSLLAHPSKLLQGAGIKWRLRGIPYRVGVWPVRAEGTGRVERVILTDGTRTWTEPCDLFACGFNLVPNVELALALGCELRDGFVGVDKWQATNVPDVYCAGEPTGIGGVDCALVEGQIAGHAAAGRRDDAAGLFNQRAAWHRFRAALDGAFTLRDELKTLASDDTLICRCEDVTLGRLKRFQGWRDAKLQSRCGMGACQGRVCGAAARVILGWTMESVRPPVLPSRMGSLVSGKP